MNPAFWNDRYASDAFVYGTTPNTFIADGVDRLPSGVAVLDLGAGEGRNAVFLAQQGFRVTAVDYAREGLRKLEQLAETHSVDIETIRADVLNWTPDRTWDAVVVTYLHLPPKRRPRLYQLIRQVLRPGGLLIAEWFRPEQVTEGYTSGGPPSAEMMVTLGELQRHFPESGIRKAEAVEAMLDEGKHHRGPAAVVRFIWQKEK